MAKNDTIVKLIENKIKNQQSVKDNKKQEKNEKDIKLNEFESLINSSPIIYADKRNIAVIIESPKTQNELSPENVLYTLLGNGKNNIIINLFKEELFKNKGFFKEIYEGDTELLKKTNALKKIDNLILGKLNYTFQKGTSIDKDLISCNINFAYKVINKNGDIVKIDNISVTSAGFTFDTALQRGIEILCETYSNRILKTS